MQNNPMVVLLSEEEETSKTCIGCNGTEEYYWFRILGTFETCNFLWKLLLKQVLGWINNFIGLYKDFFFRRNLFSRSVNTSVHTICTYVHPSVWLEVRHQRMCWIRFVFFIQVNAIANIWMRTNGYATKYMQPIECNHPIVPRLVDYWLWHHRINFDDPMNKSSLIIIISPKPLLNKKKPTCLVSLARYLLESLQAAGWWKMCQTRLIYYYVTAN